MDDKDTLSQQQEHHPISNETQPSVEEAIAPQKIWHRFDLLWISLLAIILFFAGSLALGLLIALAQGPNVDPNKLATNAWFSTGAAIIEAVALILSVYLLGILRHKLHWSDVGLRPLPKRWFWLSLALLIGMTIVTRLLLFLATLLGYQPTNPQTGFIVPPGLTWVTLILMVVFIGFIIPFAEELFFRGVLYSFLRERWGFWVAIIVSSLVFALVHFDILISSFTFVLGLVAAYAYQKSGSLWSAVVIHVGNNLVSTVLTYVVFVDFARLPLW